MRRVLSESARALGEVYDYFDAHEVRRFPEPVARKPHADDLERRQVAGLQRTAVGDCGVRVIEPVHEMAERCGR